MNTRSSLLNWSPLSATFAVSTSLLASGYASPPTMQPAIGPVLMVIHPHLFVPKYDLAGHWTSDGSVEHCDAKRFGKHVKSTYITAGYEHVFEGDYTNDHTIEGIQVRKNRDDGTVTRMHLVITLSSDDLGKAEWVALDSNSDLAKGQAGTSIIKRVTPSEQ